MKVVPVITGIGLVTPLGRSAQTTWQALLEGRHITDHARVEAIHQQNIPRVAALGIEAADQAINQANWKDTSAAVICSTSKGSVESWLHAADKSPTPVVRYSEEPDYLLIDRALRSNSEPASSDQSISFGLADLSTHIAHHTGYSTGPRLTLSSACAGGLHGLIRAAMMIQTGQADRVLVVAAEASVHPLFVGSFRRLGVLVPEGKLCRPFDNNRHGFLMSDAAAAICIEKGVITDFGEKISDDPFLSAQHGPEGHVTIDRFAMGGDATHLTGIDPQAKVLQYLLRQTLSGQPVDLVHAHGTGTVSNDNAELAAIEATLCPASAPNLFSHKAALGHSLGAAGLVAVVINCLCHKHGIVPPNINTVNPLDTSKLRVDRQVVTRPIQRSLVHAAGFGGPTAVVALWRRRLADE